MKILKTDFEGAYIIEPEKIFDERGFFARVWDFEIFEKMNLNSKIVQCNVSFNKIKGTVRGLHYQSIPFEEEKIVRCTKGKIFDVMVDLRKESKTFLKYTSLELNENNHKMLFIPKGIAHGFQTLEDNSEVFYQMSEIYKPECSKGVRYNDQKLNIKWPINVTSISKRDLSYELLD